MGKFNSSASLLALVTAIGATPALAQADDSAVSQGGIEEIIVTAQKRSENVQNVPIAISALNDRYLQSRDISSIERLSSMAPNLKMERAPSSKTISQISIRGSVTINPAVTWEPAVGLYLDGVYIAKAQGSIFDVADLERIEVLRGPQGTLYGRNTLAGAVNLVTKKPSGEAGGSVELTYGNYDYRRLKGILDLPQFGMFSVKLSGQIQKRDGFYNVVENPVAGVPAAQPIKTDETNNLNSWNGMVQVRAEPSDNVTLDYSFDYNRIRQKPDQGQLVNLNQNGGPSDIFDPGSPSYIPGLPLDRYLTGGRQGTVSIDGDVFERSKTWGHALTASLDLGGATLKSITSYRKMRWGDGLDLDGTPLPIAFTERHTRYRAFSQELQVTGTAFDDRLNYVVGAFYFKDKATAFNPQSFFGGGTTFESRYGSNTEAYAVYTQLDYELTDQLTLTGGLRYNHEEKDIMRLLVSSPNTPSSVTLIDVGYDDVPKAKYNNLSPAVTLRYEPSRNVNLYARYARGFKSGGYNGETDLVAAPTASCPTGYVEICDPYDHEKVDSYEIGAKTRLLDNTLQLNVAAFWNEHKDMQIPIFVATGASASVVRNAGAARVRGLEFEAIIRPVDYFTVNASFAVLDTKYKRFEELDGTNVADNRAFPHAPKYNASIGADWQIVEGDWGRLNLSGDMTFVSSYFTYPYALNVASPSDQNAYTSQSQGRTLVNLRAAVSEIPLGSTTAQVSLWVRNLTKEAEPANFIDFGPGFGGLNLAYYPDPRTFGITAGVRF